MHLIWLAATSGSGEAIATLTSLAKHADADIRQQVISALATVAPERVSSDVFVAALGDDQPSVKLAALLWYFNPQTPLPLEAVLPLARSSDTYLRQTSTSLLAVQASTAELQKLLDASDEPTRMAAVLAAGRKLTVPGVDDVPPASLKLSYPKESAFFKAKLHFYGTPDEIDLASLGRLGSYTMAERWKVAERSRDEEALFAMLTGALDDRSVAVQLQAAYSLSLLHDPRSEPAIARAKETAALSRLQQAREHRVERAWVLGPLAAGASSPSEQGVIDLTASYPASEGTKSWQEASAAHGEIPVATSTGKNVYVYFQLQSGSRQEGLLAVDWTGLASIWMNGAEVAIASRAERRAREKQLLIDLQPGTNDVLVRLRAQTETSGSSAGCRILVRAAAALVVALPEKLDSAQLAARLREASTASGQPISAEFVSLDWAKEMSRGDAAAGRKLFGLLACAKCHAITAGQKGGGAPSLAEARRRFTVAHVVESILLPSKQVAEPFRATTILKQDGRVLTGLVTAESADELEILLPDATRQTVRTSDIEERSAGALSPMPQGLVRSPQELRDLLAYLLSDQPLPP